MTETTQNPTIRLTGELLFTRLAYPQRDSDSSDDGKYIARIRAFNTPENQAAKEVIMGVNTNCITDEREDGTFVVKGKLSSTGTTKNGTVFNRAPKVFMHGSDTPLQQAEVPLLEAGGTATLILSYYHNPKRANYGGLNLEAVLLHDDVNVYTKTGSDSNSVTSQIMESARAWAKSTSSN